MQIASWNINSVRLRMPLVRQFLETHPVDVLCLQETKVTDDLFPHAALEELGFRYHHVRGEKGYNGVAILSRIPFEIPGHQCYGGNEQCRHIRAIFPGNIEINNFYVPAGGDIPDPDINTKFAHKLQFVRDMTQWAKERDHALPAVVLGDFNIAPLENDVWSHKQMLKIVSHTPVEVDLLEAFRAAGDWVDVHRHFTPEDQKLYSWWSYRAKDWKAADRGRRLDHIWVSRSLVPQLAEAAICKEARGWDCPSDHVPIMVKFKTS